jgi:signal transduction histidine kinase
MAHRVLIVDSDAVNAAKISTLLRPLGCTITAATSATEALANLAREPADVVIVDAILPDKSGIDIVTELRSARSEQAAFILLGAKGDEEQRLWGKRAGADEVLEKPVDPVMLAMCVRQLLNLRIAKDELRQKSQELERASHGQRSFFESLVHDLKNPIAIVHVNLAWVIDRLRADHPDLTEALSDAQEGIGRLQKMIDDLLMVNLLDQSRLLLKREPIQVTELLGRVIKSHEKEAQSRNVSLSLSLPEDLAVVGDATVLQRVVHNLVESSLRHTPSSGKIKVSARFDSGVEIAVSNTGRPLAPEEKAQLVEQTPADRDSVPVRGLALYFCKRAVEAHQGEIDVVETPEWPTSMVMRLPAKTA